MLGFPTPVAHSIKFHVQPSDMASPSVEGLKNQPNRGPKLGILKSIRGSQNLGLSRSHCHKCELNRVVKKVGSGSEPGGAGNFINSLGTL